MYLNKEKKILKESSKAGIRGRVVTSEHACRRLVTSAHHGMPAASVAAALCVCRAAPQRLVSARSVRTQSSDLQHQGGSSNTRHGVPGRLPKVCFIPAPPPLLTR